MWRMKLRSAVAMFVLTISASAAAQTANFTLKEVGKGVYAAIAVPDGKAGSNAGFVIGSNGVLVVDTFVDPVAAQELLSEIRKLTNLPVRYVFNTHYHLDHTGGNRVFAEAGATIVAHKNVRAWVRTEN